MIYLVMKRKKIQPRILDPVRLSFRFDGEIKSFPDKQVNRIQHHQTSFTTNVFSSQKTRGGKVLPTENKSQNIFLKIKKTVIGSYTPTKRHRLAEQKKTCTCMHFHLPYHSA